MPSLLAISLAVEGMSCINPLAPAEDFASGIKALSCLATARLQEIGISNCLACLVKMSLCATGNRSVKLSQLFD